MMFRRESDGEERVFGMRCLCPLQDRAYKVNADAAATDLSANSG